MPDTYIFANFREPKNFEYPFGLENRKQVGFSKFVSIRVVSRTRIVSATRKFGEPDLSRLVEINRILEIFEYFNNFGFSKFASPHIISVLEIYTRIQNQFDTCMLKIPHFNFYSKFLECIWLSWIPYLHHYFAVLGIPGIIWIHGILGI